MEGRHMARRYGMDKEGEVSRTWNGKFPEEFKEMDMLLFAADTDLLLYGRVSGTTMAAVRKAGYLYENGALIPLTQQEEQAEKNRIKGVR